MPHEAMVLVLDVPVNGQNEGHRVEGALQVDSKRLHGDLLALAEIGKSDDGIYRVGLSDSDMEARKWLCSRLQDAGLEGRLDGAANVVCRYAPPSASGPEVLIGSHLDSVPAGGSLDGALGVVVGLECLRRLAESGVQIRRPVGLVAFSDEEGRFGGLLGSKAICGELTLAAIQTAVDLDGVSLVDAMAAQGLDAMRALEARRRPETVAAFLELHIEQGPVLDRLDKSVGVVEHITGLCRWTVRLVGCADHAGTTPMDMRTDALAGFCEFASEIPRVLEEHGGEHSVATIGKADLFPGAPNTVPGRVDFSLDFRDTSMSVLGDLTNAFRRVLSALARRRSLMFEFDVVSEVAPVRCDDGVVEAISRAAADLGIEAHRLPSGAVHDAQIMSRLCPIGMIFVPSKDGRSHSSAEWTHWEDIDAGANVALAALTSLACP